MKSIGMFFNLYIANKIGSEAIGVFNLVMSVYMFAVTIATSGLSLACTCIVSEQFTKDNFLEGFKAVKTCMVFSLILGLMSSFLVLIFSNTISTIFLKSIVSPTSLYLIAIGLPFIGISSVINGYFSAVRKSYKTAFSQVFELIVKIITTIIFLQINTSHSLESICICLILADVISEICSCSLLIILFKKDKQKIMKKEGLLHTRRNFAFIVQSTNFHSITIKELINTITFKKNILKITLPISITNCIRSGLSTLKQFIIPNRLLLFGLPYSTALSEYGKINGMTMSVLLFPNVFITSFRSLLVPEFTSLSSKQYKKRILDVCQKIFVVTSIFSISTALIFFLFSNQISLIVFHNLECAEYIKILAPLILFMYPDNIIDSILMGLNKQINVMICNIIDLLLTISLLYFLLPVLGLSGYILSIIISEIFNFCISYYILYKATGFKMPIAISCCYVLFALICFINVFHLS